MRRWVDSQRVLSMTSTCRQLPERVGIEHPISIKIFHDHPAFCGKIEDEIYREAVEANKVCKHDGSDPEILKCIAEDVEKLKGLKQ